MGKKHYVVQLSAKGHGAIARLSRFRRRCDYVAGVLMLQILGSEMRRSCPARLVLVFTHIDVVAVRMWG